MDDYIDPQILAGLHQNRTQASLQPVRKPYRIEFDDSDALIAQNRVDKRGIIEIVRRFFDRFVETRRKILIFDR